MAAAASVRSLLRAFPTIQTTNSSNSTSSNSHCSLLSFSATNLFESKTLSLKTVTVKPLFLLLNSRLSFSSSFAAYTETDEDDYGDEEVEQEEEEEEEEGGGEIGLAKSPPAEETARLYVGNLPYSITSDQLAEIFSQAGTVETAEIVYDRVTDRSRGFAFVTMASGDDAKVAIRMFDGNLVGGRTVKVNFPEVPRGGEREVMGPQTRASSRGYVDSPYKVYAGNLGWSVTAESLKDAFSDQPGLLGAKVIYEYLSGRSRGFGFVSFASPEDAQSAIKMMNGKDVEGRPLRLNLASERAPTSAATF